MFAAALLGCLASASALQSAGTLSRYGLTAEQHVHAIKGSRIAAELSASGQKVSPLPSSV